MSASSNEPATSGSPCRSSRSSSDMLLDDEPLALLRRVEDAFYKDMRTAHSAILSIRDKKLPLWASKMDIEKMESILARGRALVLRFPRTNTDDVTMAQIAIDNLWSAVPEIEDLVEDVQVCVEVIMAQRDVFEAFLPLRYRARRLRQAVFSIIISRIPNQELREDLDDLDRKVEQHKVKSRHVESSGGA